MLSASCRLPARDEEGIAMSPIRHLVVLGHPAADSFSHAVARAYCEGVEAHGQLAELRDLYALGFDPLLRADEIEAGPAADVRDEVARVHEATVIALVYPIWFGMPPAIIKGYVDRVLGAGLTPRAIRDERPHAALAGRHLRIFSASGSTLPWLEEKGQWTALRQAFDTYLSTIFTLASHEHVHFDAVTDDLPARVVAERLAETRAAAEQACARAFEEKRSAELAAKLHRQPH